MKRRRLPLTLHLLVPGLLERIETWSQEVKDFPRYQYLETLLTRSHCRRSHLRGYDAVLCALAGVPSERDRDLPLGALIRYGITGEADEGFLLCADPVNLRADIQQLVLLDGGQLGLKEQESTELVRMYNDHFKERAGRLEMNAPHRWHLRLDKPEIIQTHPLREVMGKNIDPYLIEGERAMFWRNLLNEVQMLFHDSTINHARESRGEPAINSLWIFGAGNLPKPLVTDWSIIWADDPMAKGIGRAANLFTRHLPQRLDAVLNKPVRGEHVVCLESLSAPSSYDDLSAWRGHMERLEMNWFKPLLEAMREGQIDACHIHDCSGQSFKIANSHRWLFWKRPRPMFAFASAHKTAE